MALSGCGGGQPSASEITTSDGDVTLNIEWWGGDARMRATQEVVEAFEKAHPNIHVEMQYSDWSGYRDKLATQVAGGNAPDIMQMDELYLASYASQGSLLDLDSVSQWLDMGKMAKSVKDAGQYDGKQYAATIATAPFALCVNMDILNELGLSLPDNTDSWTWDEFEAFEKQIVAKSNGEIIGAGTLPAGDGLQIWALQHGEFAFKDGKVGMSENTLAQWLRKSKEYTENGISGTPDRWAEEQAATLEQSEFGRGKQAMKFFTAMQISQYAKAVGTDNLTLVHIPQDKPGKAMYMKPSQFWCISSESEHPAEAAMLVDYLINNADAGKILGTERGLPSNNAIREELKASASALDKKAFDYVDSIQDDLTDTAPDVTPNGGSDFKNIGMRYQQLVVFGSSTPEQAAKDMINEINSAIASA